MTDLWSQVSASLLRNKLRTALTMAGIAWGIASLVLTTAMGEGFRVGQENNMKHLGDNLALVFGGSTGLQAGGERAGRRIRLNYSDVEHIRASCPAVKRVTAELESSIHVSSDFNSGSFSTSGVEWFFDQLRSIPLSEGRFLNEHDQSDAARVIVIGTDVKHQLFGDRSPIAGREVLIESIPYRVIGVMQHKEQNDSYNGLDEKRIWMPYSTMARDVPPKRFFEPGFVTELLYQPASADVSLEAEKQVRAAVGHAHNFDPLDLTAIRIWDTVEDQKMVGKIFDSMTLFLGFIGVVTLSLGGIGVMNVMLVTVSERTREIGLRKALGATRARILLDFLAEGCLISLASGLIGFAAVYALSLVLAQLPMPDMFPGLPVSGKTTAVAFLVLGAITLASAALPAWRAAALTPVEALRDER